MISLLAFLFFVALCWLNGSFLFSSVSFVSDIRLVLALAQSLEVILLLFLGWRFLLLPNVGEGFVPAIAVLQFLLSIGYVLFLLVFIRSLSILVSNPDYLAFTAVNVFFALSSLGLFLIFPMFILFSYITVREYFKKRKEVLYA